MSGLGAAALVFLGAGLGGVGRHLVGLAAGRFGAGFPWGTLAVNLLGSLAMGLLVGGLVQRAGAAGPLRLFLATGLLGGFTTFSAFSLETVSLWERGSPGLAVLYVAGSVSGGVLALALGLALARAGP